MSTLADIRNLYRLTPTRFDRAYVGTATPGDWRHVFGDDLDDYAPTGPAYRTKAEALAALPAAVSDYYGLAAVPKHEQDDASDASYRVAYLQTNHPVRFQGAPKDSDRAPWDIPMTCAEIVQALADGFVITIHRP